MKIKRSVSVATALIAAAIVAGAAVATTRTSVTTLYPGELASVPSRGVQCKVTPAGYNPAGVLCFRTGPLNGTYEVLISRTKVIVVKAAAHNGSRVTYAVAQP